MGEVSCVSWNLLEVDLGLIWDLFATADFKKKNAVIAFERSEAQNELLVQSEILPQTLK